MGESKGDNSALSYAPASQHPENLFGLAKVGRHSRGMCYATNVHTTQAHAKAHGTVTWWPSAAARRPRDSGSSSELPLSNRECAARRPAGPDSSFD